MVAPPVPPVPLPGSVPSSLWRITPTSTDSFHAPTVDVALDPDALDRYEEFTAGIEKILQKYDAAMRAMAVRFEILDKDLSIKRNRNPIHHIESRIKQPVSIYGKLLRYGKEPTLHNLEEHLMDVAGVRVIVSYVGDVYSLVDLLRAQDDLEIIRIKDYIKSPKPNGYRSLHAIVRIPVYFMDNKQMVPVEVQIRTIAMDYWASLEHDLKYKAIADLDDDEGISAELKDCSSIIEGIETRMQFLADVLDASSEQ